jgi:aspartate carbamoyltransferase catalytic subunit
MGLTRKDLLDIRSLEPGEIQTILDTAVSMKEIASREIKKVPALRGKTVVNLFLEPSTRTRTSFEIAGKRLSADAAPPVLQRVRGRPSHRLNLEAMIPTRGHPPCAAGATLARTLRPVSTPAMDARAFTWPPDLLTIRDKRHLQGCRRIAGHRPQPGGAPNIGVCADGHDGNGGRATHLMPVGVEELGWGATGWRDAPGRGRHHDAAFQQERMTPPTCRPREYSRLYGLSLEKLRGARDDVLIMHPGPVNRGVEMAPEVADGPYSVILEQVANGVAVRMAILYLLLGARGGEA